MIPPLVSSAILCGDFRKKDRDSVVALAVAGTRLAPTLDAILADVVASPDDAVALLVALRDPREEAGKLFLCAVTSKSGFSSCVLVSHDIPAPPKIHFVMPLVSSVAIELMGDGIVSLKGEGQSAFVQVLSPHALWTTVESLCALRDVGASSPLRLSVKVEKLSGVGLELDNEGGEGGAAISVSVVIEDAPALFSLASLAPPPVPLSKGVYRKPDAHQLKDAVSIFIKQSPAPDDISLSEVLAHLRETYGNPIVGKYGFSKAFIDSVVFRVYGEMEPPSLIVDRLWLGSEFNAQDMNLLKECTVSHVLNVAIEVDRFFPDDFVYMKIHVIDEANADLLPFFERACEFIHLARTRGTGIFVHCQRGISRSASCVIAYIMWQERIGVKEAVALVKNKRRIVKPNAGFLAQLARWERQLGISSSSPPTSS